MPMATPGKTNAGGGTRASRRLAWIWALALSSLFGCQSPGADLHLAPFYTRVARAGGGVDTEALGGLYRHVVAPEEADRYRSELTVGPLLSFDRNGPGQWKSRFLVPLGSARRSGREAASSLIPLYSWSRQEQADGKLESNLITSIGLVLQHHEERGRNFGWFPFYGDLEDLLTFDRIHWILWPLYVGTRRGENRSHNLFYPIFHRSKGGRQNGWRVWPLAGRTRRDESYDRRFFLWPFFHYQDNLLGTRRAERIWMVWPLLGRTRRGTYRATTFLWPFFGFAYDRGGDFWAVDAPFFLVRLQRGPGEVERTRFWPLASTHRADGLQTKNFLWPIFHWRKEEGGENGRRRSFFAIPVWQSWNREHPETGKKSSWRKLFPLFQHERDGDYARGSFPTLDPFWRNRLIDRHYAWMWKLWEWERRGNVRRQRSLLGLWRREKDGFEDRRSLAGLWAARDYAQNGRRIRERSLLFGLLRWRVTQGEGFDMLPVAFPGPGWPEERAGSELRDPRPSPPDE